jgi:hypothetical protein
MGSVGGLLGMSGGQGGTGFSTLAGTNAAQLGSAYTGQQNAMGSQNALLSAMQGQNGLGNQSQTYNQMQGIVSGQGPNPAAAQLAQSTGQNVANQAAMMAGQRGAGANVGLMARQAGQQGGALQQQAAGQGATMQAQQSLNALGQAAGQANTMAGQQIGQTNQNVASQQNEQSVLQGANTANNQIQGQLANTTLQGQQAVTGGLMQGAGAAMKMMAPGGEIQNFAPGGQTGPQSMFGQTVLGNIQQAAPQYGSSDAGADALQKGVASMSTPSQTKPNDQSQMNASASVGSTPTNPNAAVNDWASLSGGGNVGNKLKTGGNVPGTPKHPGNDYKNDTVSAKLSPGEVVIPNSVMQSGDPIRGAAQFVQAMLAKKGRR